jgi:hypothetical protein
MPQDEEAKELELGEEPEEFGELVRYTLAGYVGGLVLGGLLDHLGFQSGLLFLRRRSDSWGEALAGYGRHPVMRTSLLVILAVPVGLFLARSLGFSPSTQVLTALEMIASNLCWVPPAVGWLWERQEK